jgi:phosphatidylglycerophosphate synthase
MDASFMPLWDKNAIERNLIILKNANIDEVYVKDNELAKKLGKKLQGVCIKKTTSSSGIKLYTNTVLLGFKTEKIKKGQKQLRGLNICVRNFENVKKKIFEQTAVKDKFKSVIAPYTKYVNLPISTLFAKVLLNTRLTPNMISIIGFITGLLGIFLIGFGQLMYGGGLYFLSYFFDAADGKIARAKLQKTGKGFLFDRILDLTVSTLVILVLVILVDEILYYQLGIIAIISFILMHMIPILYAIKNRAGVPIKITTQLANRDFSYFLILVFCLTGQIKTGIWYFFIVYLFYFIFYFVSGLYYIDRR